MNGGDPIARAVGAIVDSGALASAATLVWRDGKVVQRASVGWRDLEARLPLEHDSLFRIASMTKPITSTAALMLLEEGRFALTDPIARWAPEFGDMRVLRSPTGPLDETDPAERRMTSNRLTAPQRATAEVGGMPLFRGGHGFGMGVAVVLDPKKAEPTVCGGRKGSVGWPGGFGGWWRADASDSSVLIFMAHNMVERDQLSRGIGLGVYEAITRFQALASADDR